MLLRPELQSPVCFEKERGRSGIGAPGKTVASAGVFLGEDSETGAISDDALVRRVRAGDVEQYRELLRRHKQLVFACIMRQVGSQAVAEELAHETFVKAYIRLHTFRFEARFSTWLVRIALNTVASYFSSRSYRYAQRTIAFEQEQHDTAYSPTEDAEDARRRLARFRSALNGLPSRLKEVLVLCGLEGRPYEEVARLLGIPVGTVRSRLNKARLEIKNAIEEDDA